MTLIQELAATDPILGATRAQLESLQLERLRATLRHAHANNASYRQKFSAAGVHPDDVQDLAGLATAGPRLSSWLLDPSPARSSAGGV